jgi:dual specificity MAP kinase phosphatase
VKTAVLSDIIVYGRDLNKTRKVAWDIANAQKLWREKHEDQGEWMPEYHTFICTSPFSKFEESHPEIVAVDGSGHLTGNVLDFFSQERREMWAMTEASEFSKNVFMGPTPEQGSPEEQKYDILIECSDLGRLNPLALQLIAESPDDDCKQRFLDFPSSGSILPPTWSHSEADGILETCKWIYHLAHGLYPEPEPSLSTDDVDAEGDSPMPSDHESTFEVRPHKILLHCADGYTESTMLSIAYFSYSTGRPVPEAWLQLHTEKKRNFFAYPTDVALLTSITPRLLRESPVCKGLSLTDITHLTRDEPSWFGALDGSFPSRVLDYMYLGNLGHANNPDLLRALGITQILSVGEIAMWREGDLEDWGKENVCVVQGVQDNGIDPLTEEFARCLEFIGKLNLLEHGD